MILIILLWIDDNPNLGSKLLAI